MIGAPTLYLNGLKHKAQSKLHAGILNCTIHNLHVIPHVTQGEFGGPPVPGLIYSQRTSA